MRLDWIPHLSPAYALCVALRRDILRKPLGLEFTEAQLAAEGTSLHLACFEGETLVGTLVLAPVSPEVVQMRQVAVHDGHQGQGLGSRMVVAFEAAAQERGFERIILHARETAVPFYRRLGYHEVGEPYLEVGLPHRTMEKEL